MEKRKPKPGDERFYDDLVFAKPGEVVETGAHVDRRGPDYAEGAKARRAGQPRDVRRSLSWLAGYDEATGAR
jgi:hypothetical protein